MGNEKYSMSFTTGGLFHRESVELAGLYLELGDWSVVRDKVFRENLLQTRTMSTLKRIGREVISRLKTLNSGELELLADGSAQEQGYLLWLAVCRRYKFIADFAIEVLREHYITLKPDLSYEDYDSFFNRKSEWHSELERISPSTRIKIRQIIFKMLRDSGLLTANNVINAAMLSPKLLDAISHGQHRDDLCFPIFESDLKGMAK